MLRKVLSYARSVARWRAAGRPVRSSDERRRIFEEICRLCPNFVQRRRGGGRCGICGCGLNIGSEKLSFATEECPDTPPRWYATAGPLAQNRQTERKVTTRRERMQARAARIAARQAGTAAKQARIAERAQKRADREARKARKRADREAMGGPEPPLAQVQENADPLKCYDRDGQPIGHVFRGWWGNCAAFLVGGGPSLKQLDLGFLRERGIASLGINNVCGYAPVRAMTFSDPPEKFHHGCLFDPAVIKFVPLPKLKQRVRAKLPDGTFRWTAYTLRQCPSVVAFERDGIWRPEDFLTREAATWGVSQKHEENKGKDTRLFTFFIGLRLMHYLGVRRVYLLGVDFGMTKEAGYAFGQYRWESAVRGNNNTYRWASSMLMELRPVFERAGFQVFQTNRDSALKVFDHVPLEAAIEDCRGVVPKEPFSLDHWYEKRAQDANPERQQTGPEERGE